MPELSASRPQVGARARLVGDRRVTTRAIGAGIIILLLAGCAKQDEETVRLRLSEWVNLGDTRYFHSEVDCSAAVFDLKSNRVSSKVKRARSLEVGVAMIGREQAVVFDIKGESPHSLTQRIMSQSLHQGIGILSSGLSGKNCMTEELQVYYYRTLLEETADLVFDPIDKAMIVVDTENKQLFYARGDG